MRVKLFESEDKAKETLANNQPRLVRAGGQEVCVVRKNDQIFAFQNACNHKGESLHKGHTNHLDEIVCPLHSYRFNMKTGDECNRRCSAIRVYVTENTKEGIFLVL